MLRVLLKSKLRSRPQGQAPDGAAWSRVLTAAPSLWGGRGVSQPGCWCRKWEWGSATSLFTPHRGSWKGSGEEKLRNQKMDRSLLMLNTAKFKDRFPESCSSAAPVFLRVFSLFQPYPFCDSMSLCFTGCFPFSASCYSKQKQGTECCSSVNFEKATWKKVSINQCTKKKSIFWSSLKTRPAQTEGLFEFLSEALG